MLELDKLSKIIAANWKMNGSIKFIDNFLNQLDLINNHNKFICTIICPPFIYSQYVSKQLNNLTQNLSSSEYGLYLLNLTSK